MPNTPRMLIPSITGQMPVKANALLLACLYVASFIISNSSFDFSSLPNAFAIEIPETLS
jgi:hypothetical protein